MKLIIVESPNKIKSIKSYLDSDYEVIATYGHFRELDKKFGYNPETFEPKWTVIKDKVSDKEKIIKNIKEKSKDAEIIYLATDPDREGEAISWHIYDILPDKLKQRTKRIIFNEITKKAILNSIENSKDIDFNLVDSQFCRRIFDRMIGYKLSSFVKSKLQAISAGRVQSIALLFIVERAKERERFIPTNWWEVFSEINSQQINFIDFNSEFESIEPTRNNLLFKFKNKVDAEKVVYGCSNEFVFYKQLDPKISYSDKLTPLTTDKLLQLGMTYFNWGASKTTLVAQKLFEGIEINNDQIGLISYPRTDSQRLNIDFCNEIKDYINTTYGNEYFEEYKIKETKKEENVQDAHEAIRPVDIKITPEYLESSNVEKDVIKLYSLIWSITLASFLKQAQIQSNIYLFKNNNYYFSSVVKKIIFSGYYILDFFKKLKKDDLDNFKDIKENQVFVAKSVEISEHSTQPPAYYTEATLISALKKSGVGRPSTYATMAKISESRGYVNKEQQKLIPNEMGINVIESLQKNFPNIISKEFTSHMEEKLDEIAEGKLEWKVPLKEFSGVFSQELKQAYETQEKQIEYVGEKCELCGNELIYKHSRFNQRFIGCSGFPECKFTKSIHETIILDENCPECNHKLCERTSKKNQKFIGCTNFPKCRYVKSKQ